MLAQFPQFREISLEDRDFVQDKLWKYQPETSELTFTNLFIWRTHYGTLLSQYQDWLLIVLSKTSHGAIGLSPIGPPSRQSVARLLLNWLKEKGESEPRLERADRRFISELADVDDFVVEPVRDDFDYVYRSQDLIELSGRKYHAKRNFINTFRNSYQLTYGELTESELPVRKWQRHGARCGIVMRT